MKSNLLTTLGFLISSIFLLSSCKPDSANCPTIKEAVTPTVMQKVELINAYTPAHVANLTNLVIALEKYKQKHRSYPISSRGKNDWDRLITDTGINEEWLNALTPAYLTDIRATIVNPSKNQYVYMSNGANYKLLVYDPKNCGLLQTTTPNLIDSRRNCKAYGFWTEGAKNW